jgi:hypothetical protein
MKKVVRALKYWLTAAVWNEGCAQMLAKLRMNHRAK